MSRRLIGFAVFALAISLGCARLGFWQISRLHERQARNAMIVSRLDAPPVPASALAGDTGVRFRRATALGRYDYDHELLYATRPRQGSPGVNFLTPLLIGSGDTALLVNRGWVYSPDGMTVDALRWREGEGYTAHVGGFVEEFAPADEPVSTHTAPTAVRRLDFDSIQARMPYPILPLILVQQIPPDSAAVQRVPVRIDPPPLSEGPHRSYAIQWFGFALIGIVGTVMVIERDRRRSREARERAEYGQTG
jgi:surfeit locus 1 family protein